MRTQIFIVIVIRVQNRGFALHISTDSEPVLSVYLHSVHCLSAGGYEYTSENLNQLYPFN